MVSIGIYNIVARNKQQKLLYKHNKKNILNIAIYGKKRFSRLADFKHRYFLLPMIRKIFFSNIDWCNSIIHDSSKPILIE